MDASGACQSESSALRNSTDRRNWDARILATDLNTEVLASASAGVYSKDTCEKLPADLKKSFLTAQPADDKLAVKPDVKNLITFKQLNLLGPWPMRHPFDIIFCRNVLIYFDNETKSKLINRFVSVLRPGGWLYLGHSETLNGHHEGLALTGRTIYRREP
jgi:chemotaxis protein methyltransferase CheR